MPKNKKELRPYTFYFSADEVDLVSSLVTLAAAGRLKMDQKYIAVAYDLHKRLTKLILKYQTNVQKNPSDSSAGILQSGGSPDGDQSRSTGGDVRGS